MHYFNPTMHFKMTVRPKCKLPNPLWGCVFFVFVVHAHASKLHVYIYRERERVKLIIIVEYYNVAFER